MAETTITITIDPELKTAFSRAAEARNRTDEELLREFIQDYVETKRTDSEYGFAARCKLASTRRTRAN
jgi:predicted transcriptional regulator